MKRHFAVSEGSEVPHLPSEFGIHTGGGGILNIDDRKRKEDELAMANVQLAEQNALLKNFNAALELLAASDAMTGLANRRALSDMGAKECKRAERFGHPLSLLMIDIDLFKEVNDVWGHMAGDLVICAVADACRNRTRTGLDFAARVGGEEFVIVLPETDFPSAHILAESLCAAVAQQRVPVNEAGNEVGFTVSIGVATAQGGNLSFERLMNHADKALYLAKQAGRNNVKAFGHPVSSTLSATQTAPSSA